MGFPDFSHRAVLSELMDDDDVDLETFRACLKDLAKANVATFTHRPTLVFLADLAREGRWPVDRPLHILDLGSGYGDGLRRIERWAAQRKLPMRLTGLDRNPWAAESARAATAQGHPIEWLTCDVFAYDGRPDVIVSSLFTHHLDDAQIIRVLRWMDERAALGWFINDLERNVFAWGGFSLLARLMRWHPFVVHDGPVSIRRAFSPADWRGYLARAGIDGAKICRRFPFRLCVSKTTTVGGSYGL